MNLSCEDSYRRREGLLTFIWKKITHFNLFGIIKSTKNINPNISQHVIDSKAIYEGVDPYICTCQRITSKSSSCLQVRHEMHQPIKEETSISMVTFHRPLPYKPTIWRDYLSMFRNVKFNVDILCSCEDANNFSNWNLLENKRVRIITALDKNHNIFVRTIFSKNFAVRYLKKHVSRLMSRFVIVDNSLLITGNVLDKTYDIFDMNIQIKNKEIVAKFSSEFEILFSNSFLNPLDAVGSLSYQNSDPNDCQVLLFRNSLVERRNNGKMSAWLLRVPQLSSIRCWIRETKKSLDICVYNFTLEILRIDVEYVAEYLPVRIITNDFASKKDCQASKLQRKSNITVKYLGSKSSSLMHHKFAVRDSNALLQGSFNWTYCASTNNYENILLIKDNQVVKCFQNEFNHLWNIATFR